MATNSTDIINIQPIVKSYATLIKYGRKTLDQVPERIRDDVEAYLASIK